MTHSLDCDTPLFVVHVSNMAAELVETQVQDVPEVGSSLSTMLSLV